MELSVVPGMQDDGKTVIFTDDSEKERVYQHLEDISVNIEIDENGVVRSKE